jgi:tetratricopeptide (TPR) repeat protein
MREKRYLEAVKLLSDKASDSGSYMKLSFNLGLCYYKLGRFDEALEPMIRANQLAPGSAFCKWGLGLVYLKKKEFKTAENLLAQSLQKKDFYPARIALTLAYLSQGKVTEAEQTHLDGIKLRPDRREGYKGYAAFLSDVGRDHEAERMEQKARELTGIN